MGSSWQFLCIFFCNTPVMNFCQEQKYLPKIQAELLKDGNLAAKWHAYSPTSASYRNIRRADFPIAKTHITHDWLKLTVINEMVIIWKRSLICLRVTADSPSQTTVIWRQVALAPGDLCNRITSNVVASMLRVLHGQPLGDRLFTAAVSNRY